MTIHAAFARFPSLTTSRLRLRPVEPSDAEAIFAIKSDEAVTVPYGQEPHRSPEDTGSWIQRIQVAYQRREALFWCLTRRDDDSPIGACTLWNFAPGFRCAELGYELHPAHWQQGLMTEAVSAVLTYGFFELGLHRIEAVSLADNSASRNLLLKLGFTHEGLLRQRHLFRGHFQDQVYFGLLKAEWAKSAAAASFFS